MHARPTMLSSCLLALAPVALFLWAPLAIAYGQIGPRMWFNLLATDTMYYLGLAQNTLHYGFPTLSGDTATNGFHPLWWTVLTLLFAITGPETHTQLPAVMLLCIALVSGAFFLAGLSLMRLLGKRAGFLAQLCLFPGLYSLCLEMRRHAEGDPGLLYTQSPLAFINGMETPLSLFLAALILWLMVSRFAHARWASQSPTLPELMTSPVRWLLGLLLLSRLDEVFLLAPLALAVLFQLPGAPRQRLHQLARIFLPAAALLSFYIACNYMMTGLLLPISANAKITPGYPLWESISLAWRQLPHGWHMVQARLLPQLVLLGAGLLLFLYARRASLSPLLRACLRVLAASWFFRAAFYLSCVHLFSQGAWYFSVMLFELNLLAAAALGAAYASSPALRAPLWLALALILPTRAANEHHFLRWINPQRVTLSCKQTQHIVRENYADMAFALWCHGDAIRAQFEAAAPGAKLIETWDGMFTYFIGLPSHTVTGLAASPADRRAIARDGFWGTMLAGGFSLQPQWGYIPFAHDAARVECAQRIAVPNMPLEFCKMAFKPELK